MEDQIRQALIDELRRQAQEKPHSLQIAIQGDTAKADGTIDLLALAAAVTGAVAGGP